MDGLGRARIPFRPCEQGTTGQVCGQAKRRKMTHMTPAALVIGMLVLVGLFVAMVLFNTTVDAKNKPHSAGETHDSTNHAPDHGETYVRDGDVSPE